MNKIDILRPVSGFFFIQPFVILWLIFTDPTPAPTYLRTGWSFQIYMTLLFMPYYAWFERTWNPSIKKDTQ